MNQSPFLASLSPDSQRLLSSRSTGVSLAQGTVLYEPEEIPAYAYLLTSGVASTLTTTRNGDSAEVGLVGHEGIVGSLQLLGPAPVMARSIMQIEGTALRIPLPEFRDIFRSSEEVRNRVLEFVQNEALTIIQIAGCHRLHGTEQRLSRWLLMVQDRVQSDEVKLTQSFLALMLGIRRPTVTLVARALQRRGMLDLRRGYVKILDRPRLESITCECYEKLRDLYINVYKRHPESRSSAPVARPMERMSFSIDQEHPKMQRQSK